MKIQKKKDDCLPEIFPEEMVSNHLHARCHVFESPKEISLNFWWGREQKTAKKIGWFHLLFPWPNKICRGNGIFEEIIYRLNNLNEIATTSGERGDVIEDYQEVIKKITSSTNAVVIRGISGREFKNAKSGYLSVSFTIMCFLKENKKR